jgi:transcription initiation factor TFIID subunit TAF12
MLLVNQPTTHQSVHLLLALLSQDDHGPPSKGVALHHLLQLIKDERQLQQQQQQQQQQQKQQQQRKPDVCVSQGVRAAAGTLPTCS